MPHKPDPEPINRTTSDAVKGDKAADPVRPTSTDKDERAPKKKVETDMGIEDAFEATDN